MNGMVHVHVMYVCNPYVICESRFLSAGWSLGAVILLYNDLRVKIIYVIYFTKLV